MLFFQVQINQTLECCSQSYQESFKYYLSIECGSSKHSQSRAMIYLSTNGVHSDPPKSSFP